MARESLMWIGILEVLGSSACMRDGHELMMTARCVGARQEMPTFYIQIHLFQFFCTLFFLLERIEKRLFKSDDRTDT